MRPFVVVDAWHEPSGAVLLTRSRLLPGRLTVLRSVRRATGELTRRTCVPVGDRLVVSRHSGVELLLYAASRKWVDRVRRR